MAEKTPEAKSAAKHATAKATTKEATAKRDDLDALGWIGHGVPVALGAASLVAAVFAWRSDMQLTLTISLVVIALLLPFLAWRSLRGSRAGWSFLIALSTVLGIMTLFGAPKIRNLVFKYGLDEPPVAAHLFAALVIPALFALAVFALSVQDRRYKNQG